MAVRNLFKLIVVLLCLAGCEKEKKDDAVIKRRERGIVRFVEGLGPTTPPVDIPVDGEDGGDCGDGSLPDSLIVSVSDGMLYISLLDQGVYDLYILNEQGTIMYSSQLPADGQTYEYDISAINGADLFALLLVGPNGSLEWLF